MRIIITIILLLFVAGCKKMPPSGDPIFEQPAEQWPELAKDIELDRLIRLHKEVERYNGKDIYFDDEFARRGKPAIFALLDFIEEKEKPINDYKNTYIFMSVLSKMLEYESYNFCKDKEVRKRIIDVSKKTLRSDLEVASYISSVYERCN